MVPYEKNESVSWYGAGVEEAESAVMPETGAKSRILIVEDDWLTLQMLKRRLEKRNYEVVTASDEKEFWKQAFDSGISLIILDLCLKNRLGTDVYKSLLDFGADRYVPVIFTTGMIDHSGASQNAPILREDNYAFMEKPIQFEKLTEEIERLLHYRKIRGVA